MVNSTLALGTIGPWELLIVLIVSGIPVVLVVVFFRLLLRDKKENIRLRLEVGKLADELECLRKQKGAGHDEPSGQSG
jgi:hypothetical protein